MRITCYAWHLLKDLEKANQEEGNIYQIPSVIKAFQDFESIVNKIDDRPWLERRPLEKAPDWLQNRIVYQIVLAHGRERGDPGERLQALEQKVSECYGFSLESF